MNRRFVLEDDTHAEVCGEFSTMEEAIAALKHLARVPWGERPNVAPCMTGVDCERSYALIEYEGSDASWNQVRRTFVLQVSAAGAVWSKVAEELMGRD